MRRTLVALGLALAGGCATPLPPDALPPRQVPLGQTMNTRDLGGYATADGRRVRWGLLYRSDQLDRLDRDDVEALAERGLRTVFDFRTDVERAGRLDRVPATTTEVWLPISFPSLDPRLVANRILRGDIEKGYFDDMLQRANRSFALDHGPELSAFVTALAEPGTLPALFHCTYGKDRTGFASALVLELLGVPWETVLEDFVLSNVYMEKNTARLARFIWLGSMFRVSRADASDLLGVHPRYLQAAHDALLAEYGSVDAYATAIGITDRTVARLRDALLE